MLLLAQDVPWWQQQQQQPQQHHPDIVLPFISHPPISASRITICSSTDPLTLATGLRSSTILAPHAPLHSAFLPPLSPAVSWLGGHIYDPITPPLWSQEPGSSALCFIWRGSTHSREIQGIRWNMFFQHADMKHNPFLIFSYHIRFVKNFREKNIKNMFIPVSDMLNKSGCFVFHTLTFTIFYPICLLTLRIWTLLFSILGI